MVYLMIYRCQYAVTWQALQSVYYLAGYRLTVSDMLNRLLAVGCTGPTYFELVVDCSGKPALDYLHVGCSRKVYFRLASGCTGTASFELPVV